MQRTIVLKIDAKNALEYARLIRHVSSHPKVRLSMFSGMTPALGVCLRELGAGHLVARAGAVGKFAARKRIAA